MSTAGLVRKRPLPTKTPWWFLRDLNPRLLTSQRLQADLGEVAHPLSRGRVGVEFSGTFRQTSGFQWSSAESPEGEFSKVVRLTQEE